VNGLSDKFSKLEDLKVGMVDQIENDSSRLRGVQTNDEFLMGAGLIIFVIALSLLSLQEFNRIQLQREIEREALNLLRAGQSNVGAMVDRLVDRALLSQSMPVTAQIFRDYHEELLERMSSRPAQVETRAETKTENVTPTEAEVETQATGPRTSLKEVLVSLQNVHPADMIQLTEVRDVQLAVNFESFEQMMNSAVNKLNERRVENKKIMITNQIHSDRSVISLFVAGTTFTATELEFATSAQNAATDGIDMNLFILKEMVAEAGAQWHLENKTDRIGAITGMNIRFVVNRAPKENKSKLVSVMRGKKKDLSRELMN